MEKFDHLDFWMYFCTFEYDSVDISDFPCLCHLMLPLQLNRSLLKPMNPPKITQPVLTAFKWLLSASCAWLGGRKWSLEELSSLAFLLRL